MYSRLSAADTAKRIDTSIEKGLSEREVQSRLSLSGSNTIAQEKKESFIKAFFRQINEPMIYILLAAAALSAFVNEWPDAVVILAIILINAIIGVVQERKAEKALDALRRMTVTHCTVRREGKVLDIPADELAVGDIVILSAGCVVPADLRLSLSANLEINESALTGESVPAGKDAEFIASEDIPLGDRVNMAYQGTVVTAGRGEGMVVATGMSTEVGRIAEMLSTQDSGKTPLQKKLAQLGKLLGLAAVGACAAIFVIGLIQKRDFWEILLTAISLAVAIIPEGLTAVVTIVLALGVTRMARRSAIVRHLPAVETLGSVNVICSDKTGTLTQNRMTVTSAFCNGARCSAEEFSSDACLPMLHGLALCNDASVEGSRTGDPTELALLDFAEKFGVSAAELNRKFERIGEIPFDSTIKRMTTLHRAGAATLSYTKGAEDIILPRCTHIWDNGAIRRITDDDREKIDAVTLEMSREALRVFAVAMRSGDTSPSDEGMLFLGLVGMIDPPREEAIRAIKLCKGAGIRVMMITGDHKITAAAIGRQTGIIASEDQVMSGAELDELSDEALDKCIGRLRILARVDPRHKVRIVNALRAQGNIVCMTGDGVNDAPSLKAADIGVAMGITGTDAAKDASDLILTDDNFETITHAVEEGRNIFGNIRKAIHFLLSSNMGELFSVLFAVLFAWDSPLLPLHILWINLITDSLPALALGVDNGDADIMKQPPRKQSKHLFELRDWVKILGYGAVIAAATLTAFRVALVRSGSLDVARTFALVTLAASQLFHSVSVRIGARSVFRANHLSNRFFLLALLVGIALQVIILYIPPLAALFDTAPIGIKGWGFILALSLAPIAVHELVALVKFLLARPKKSGRK